MEFTAQQNAGSKQVIQIARIAELSQNSSDHSRSRTNQCVGRTNSAEPKTSLAQNPISLAIMSVMDHVRLLLRSGMLGTYIVLCVLKWGKVRHYYKAKKNVFIFVGLEKYVILWKRVTILFLFDTRHIRQDHSNLFMHVWKTQIHTEFLSLNVQNLYLPDIITLKRFNPAVIS